MSRKTVEKADIDGRMKEYVEKKRGFTTLRLLSYFKHYKFMTALSITLAVMVNIASITQPYILKIVIDKT